MNSTTPDLSTWEGINMSVVFSPFYWGTVASLILSGITILQAWNYFPGKDRLPIRILAGVILTLDIASTALVSQGLYYYIVPHFGSLLPLRSIVPTLSAECTLTTVIIFLSQTYFAFQIYTVYGNGQAKYIVPGLVMLFSVVSFAGGIGCVYVMFSDSTQILGDRSYRFNVFAGIVKGSAAVADIIATVALCLLLDNSRTGLKQTDTMLKTLIQYLIQRGVAVTLLQILLLVLFFATPQYLYWLAFHVNVTRMYANTFFVMLNGRETIRKKQNPMSFMSTIIGSAGTSGAGTVTYNGEEDHVVSSDVKLQHGSDDDFHSPQGVKVVKTVYTSSV